MVKVKLLPKLVSSPFFLPELFFRYLSFLIFPSQRASYFYNVPKPHPHPYPLNIKFWALAGLAALFLAIIIYIIRRRRETAPLFALLLLPCLSSMCFSLYIDTIMIERYLYLPTVGLALLAGWGFLQLSQKGKKMAGVILVIILGAYLGATIWRTPLWKNEAVLWEALKKEYPASPYIRANLGVAYHNTNRLLEANQEISEAIKLDPLDFRYRNNFGRLCLRLGWIYQAREAYSESLRLAPNNTPALEGMGLTYMLEGDYDRALKYLDMALSADPQYESALKYKTAVLARIQTLKR